MLLVQYQGLNYFQFPGLAHVPGLFHGIMTRYSGHHQARQSFNLGLNCGEPKESVWDNRYRMLAAFGTGYGIFAHQVHGNRVAVWPDHAADKHTGNHYANLEGDALATSVSGHALVIQTADCQSVLLADPIKGVAANVHCGWRGSIQNLLADAIAIMVARWDCRSGDILCGIGPSLGPCCAEFVHYREEIPEHYWDYRIKDNHFDFWQISTDQLQAAGVPGDHIEVSRICTKCNQHLFFSYRGNNQSGRFASLIGWSPTAQNRASSEGSIDDST